MELASATPLDGHEYSNFCTAVGKLIFMALCRPDMQFAIQQLSTQVLNPTSESKRGVKHLIRCLKGTQHTCLLLEPREMVQTGLVELVGRSDSVWAGAECHGISLRCTERNNVQPKSETDCNISLSSCEAEFYAASACAVELLGLAELFKELHYKVSVRLEMDSDSARHILQRRPGRRKHKELRCLAFLQWVRAKRLSVIQVDTKNNTADLFTKHLDGLRTRALAEKLGPRFLDMVGGTNVGIADGVRTGKTHDDIAFNKRLQLSRGVSSFSLNIDICTLTQSLPCCCLLCFFFFFLSLSTDRHSSVVQCSS